MKRTTVCLIGSGISSTDMSGPPREWKAVSIKIPSRYENELVGMLSRQVLGVQVHTGDSGESTLEFFVESVAESSGLELSIYEALGRLGIDPEGASLSALTVKDGRWVENYQDSLRPFPAGKRFVIHPGKEPPDPSGERIPIRLVPGRAFGTGEHATTRLCLEALERAVETGTLWLDLGCGSGILSVAAAKLGAGQVTAVDSDPEAAEVCREVVTVNGVAGIVQVLDGSLERVERSTYDGVVVNIHAPFFREHSTLLAGLLNPGGVMIGTGFLEIEISEIQTVLEDASLRVRYTGSEEDWAVLVAETLPGVADEKGISQKT